MSPDAILSLAFMGLVNTDPKSMKLSNLQSFPK
jgi:hypothetical protein